MQKWGTRMLIRPRATWSRSSVAPICRKVSSSSECRIRAGSTNRSCWVGGIFSTASAARPGSPRAWAARWRPSPPGALPGCRSGAPRWPPGRPGRHPAGWRGRSAVEGVATRSLRCAPTSESRGRMSGAFRSCRITRPVSSMPRMSVRTETLDRSAVIFTTVPDIAFSDPGWRTRTVRCANRLSYAPSGRPDHLFARSHAGRCVEPMTGGGRTCAGTRPGRVIVVGAGPTGLLLAGELALAGVPCVVIERRDGLRADSRAICLQRGAWNCSTCAARRPGSPGPGARSELPPRAPGRGDRLRPAGLDFPYLLDMPQSQIEALLAGWATGLGAEIRWSAEVTGIEQDAGEVRVTLADGTVERAAYLAGCDGSGASPGGPRACRSRAPRTRGRCFWRTCSSTACP